MARENVLILCAASGIAQELNKLVSDHEIIRSPQKQRDPLFPLQIQADWAVIRDLRISSEFLFIKCYISRG